MDIGKSIIIALKDKGMKKKELALRIDAAPATVSALCKNKACSGKRLGELAKAFGMPVSEFIALGE